MNIFPNSPEKSVLVEEPSPAPPTGARVAADELPLNEAEVASPERVYFSLLQTVTTTFLTGPELLCLRAEATCSQGRTRIFEYGFTRGRKGFPLVFFIPGFGCPYNHGTVLYMTERLHRRGFHVAVLHSPSHPDFLMSSHHSGVGGIFSEDARDAMIGIQAISDQLRHMGVDYGARHLIGYSMGALNAAFARTLESQTIRIFERVVLINPPVDLAHGMRQLDGFVRALTMSRAAKARLVAKASAAIVLPKKLRLNRQRLIEKFLERPIWTEEELRALIGYSFEGTVSGGFKVALLLGTFSADQVVRTFSDYCQLATVPHYQRSNPNATVLDFYQSESIGRIANELARDEGVFVLHNEDDFLLRPKDAAWLRSAFGHKAHVFKVGGHLGNVWRPEFQAVLETSLGL